MRCAFLTLIFLSTVARAELGGLTNPAAKPKPKPKQETSYRTSEQDQQYQATQDAIDKGYNQQTTAVNSPKYDEFLKANDDRYEQVIANINAGGNGNVGPMLSYTPEKVPDGTPTGTPTSTAHSTTTASTAASASAPAAETLSPQQRLIQNYCPSVCAQIKDEQRAYACKTDCIHTASMMSAPEPKENNVQLLALIMNDLRQ